MELECFQFVPGTLLVETSKERPCVPVRFKRHNVSRGNPIIFCGNKTRMSCLHLTLLNAM